MKGLILAISLLFTLHLQASKVVCNSLYSMGKESLSNLPFIPLSTFIESEKNIFAVRSWSLKRNMKSIGPGIGIMYQTANDAATKVMSSLKISPDDIYHFDKPSGNILQDFTQTVKVMMTRKYKYIQNALVLDTNTGVYTILPLAKYDATADTYVPIVIKGHQDLKKSDIMSAAITSYAIGPYMGSIPKTAKVLLRPIVAKRKSTNINEAEHDISIENEKVKIKEIYERFITENANFSETLEQTQYDFFEKNPNASREQFLKNAVEPLLTPQKENLTQVPYAASKQQRGILAKAGYGSKKELATLDINSQEFIDLVIKTGMAPYRLKYMVGRSRAFVADDILILESYEDPGKDLDFVVHFDIEGAFEPEIKSGSYYLGVEFQSQKTIGAKVKEYNPKDKNPDKIFLGGFREFTQANVDKAWADFLRLLKTDKRLSNGKYKIAVYSSYEEVKVNQLVDIRKDKPENFSKTEKNSTITIKGQTYPLYKEMQVYAPIPGKLERQPKYKTVGYLIRRKEFFETHPDLTPTDVFNYKEKLFDMLPFYRHFVAGPAKNNSLKSLLIPVQKELPSTHKVYSYGNGDNGLNCIAWYYHYIKTGDPTYLERIRTYLELDIDGNRMLWDFIRRHAHETIDPSLNWTPKTVEKLKKSLPILSRMATLKSLQRKQDALEQVLGTKISQLTDQDFMTLAEILDRGAYLGDRKALINNKRLSKKRVKAILNHQKNNFETQRKKLFLEFAKTHNPKINTEQMSAQTQDALYYLFSLPSGQITQNSLNKMFLKSQMQAQVLKTIQYQDLHRRYPDISIGELLKLLKDIEITEISTKLRKANFKLLRYNFIAPELGTNSIKEYGFDEEFEKYESVNLKEIWEALFIEALFLKE